MCPDRVDYDDVAAAYDSRYSRYDWTVIAHLLRRFVSDNGDRRPRVLEVGCGTGHWLQVLEDVAAAAIGLDPSSQMLLRAAEAAPRASLVRARAEALPLATASVDRVFSVNAVHHFTDRRAFAGECHRVLEKGGRFVSIGLDPHTGLDSWWVYDYFPGSLSVDLTRYASAAELSAVLTSAGFERVTVEVAQRIVAAVPFEDGERSGVLDRRAASQFLVIGDDEYSSGIERLRRERPTLRSDLRLFAVRATAG